MKSFLSINQSKTLAFLGAISVLTLLADCETIANAQGGGEQQSGRSGRRRSFDPAGYLQRLDANSNGAIEPSELSDRSRSFIEGLGFNPDETNSLEKIKAKISGDQKTETRGDKESTGGSALGSPDRKIVRKVPGFGVTAAERKPVPNFTTVSQPSSGELDGKYGTEIMSQVDAAMSRYDKNSDGKIDQSEMSEGRWGQPEPKESDTNGDGSLSRAEMAERYYRRTRGASSTDSASSSRSSSERRDSSSSRDGGSDDRDSRRSFSRTESPSRDDSNRGSGERPAGEGEQREAEPVRSSGGSDRYRKYADGLMEQYDTDKDGNLSKEEVVGMKQKPENADLDKNGVISAGELTEAIANGSMSSRGGASTVRTARERSSAGSEAGSKNSESGSSGDSSRSGSSRSSGSKFSFLASDKNRDGNVQMHEFTDEWSDEKFEEFKSYDKNGDGMITNAEYRGDSGGRRR